MIQAAFGWWDYHLHEFEIGDTRYGVPDPDDDDWSVPTNDESGVRLDSVVGPGSKIVYIYDFGDEWRHDIVVEKLLLADDSTTVPACVDGRRACPPEDSGGTSGYRQLLGILADPRHPAFHETDDSLAHDQSTVKAVHVVLHKAFGSAVKWERLAKNPIDQADPPRVPVNADNVRTWTPEQLRTFLGFTASSADRNHALWVLLTTSGMRRGEALGLRWQDVDLDAGRLRVVQTILSINGKIAVSEPKTTRGRRRSRSTRQRWRCCGSTGARCSRSGCSSPPIIPTRDSSSTAPTARRCGPRP